MTDTSSMSEIPDDIMESARECLVGVKFFPPSDMEPTVVTVAQAILAERDKAEKLADEMYLTGVHDAYAWAKRWGHQDFAERLVREVNERAEKSGLPRLEVRR